MENKEENSSITLTLEGKLKCYKDLKGQLIKLLYMIESEQKGETDISLWFYGFVFDLASSNILCDEALTKVLVKIHGLYDSNHYKEMTHAQIKRQIMESKGIVDSLIKTTEKEIAEKK